MRLLLAIATSVALTSALAFEPIPITADEAFDAVQTQTDPLLGTPACDPQGPKCVKLVDVRSRAEYYWVGTAAQVDEIVLKGETAGIKPDWGKVRLIHEGKFLEYTVHGRYRRVQVEKVAELKTSPIALSIPYRLWDESEAKLVANGAFETEINALADQGAKVLIVFCRTGGRSTSCILNLDPAVAGRFAALYEIDDPSGLFAGFGGFEGSSYKEVYNGYLGFPGRLTEARETPSASWKDAGLPMRTLVKPE
jgi:rhodanese-related sulfurtransferase